MPEHPRSRAQRLREDLAEQAHTSWSGWMRYLLFEKSVENADGTVTIPADLVERWKRQLSTAYADLPENEKQSDRIEADHYLVVIADYLPESLFIALGEVDGFTDAYLRSKGFDPEGVGERMRELARKAMIEHAAKWE